MSVLLTTREVGGVVVLDIAGRLTVSDNTLRNVISQLLKDGKRQFVLKMNDVSYVDSCGLGQLVSVYTSVTTAGGSVKLLIPSEKVRALLNLTKLNSVFDIIEDVGPFTIKANSAGS